jgi:acyl-CoA thioesterase
MQINDNVSLERAQKTRAIIGKKDKLVTLFGMDIREVEPGRAVVCMSIGSDHINSAQVCHGGTIFALADVAFALACNSHGPLALAVDMSISFLRPVPVGESITATCTEKHRGRKLGSYQIEVTNSRDQAVALLKATAFVTDQVLEESTDFSSKT